MPCALSMYHDSCYGSSPFAINAAIGTHAKVYGSILKGKEAELEEELSTVAGGKPSSLPPTLPSAPLGGGGWKKIRVNFLYPPPLLRGAPEKILAPPIGIFFRQEDLHVTFTLLHCAP